MLPPDMDTDNVAMLPSRGKDMEETSGNDDMGEVPGRDAMASSGERWLPPLSNFPKIYKNQFKIMYREIDTAIHKSDFNYLQKLVAKEMAQTVNLSDDPLLSVVIAYGKGDLAMKLVGVMPETNLMASNCYGDTVLHVAAAKGDVRVVEALVKKCKNLIAKTNENVETPLHKAALYGEREVFWKLVEHKSDILQRRKDGSNMLHCAVMGNAPDLAMEIANGYKDLMTSRNSNGVTPLQLLLTIPEAFRSNLRLGTLGSFIYNCIPLEEKVVPKFVRDEEELEIPTDDEKQFPMTRRRKFSEHYSTLCDLLEWIYILPVTWIRQLLFNVLKQLSPSLQSLQLKKQNHTQATELIAFLASEPGYWDFFNKGGNPFKKGGGKRLPKKQQGNKTTAEVRCCCQKENAIDDDHDEIIQWTESPLILGAKMGLDELVKQILTNFPQSASNLDTEGRNVLQVAIKYGHIKIVKLIESMTSGSNPNLPSWLLSSIDRATKNTILHFAAEKTVKDEGFALQMQYELKWFEQVRNIVPKDLEYSRNKSEKTAQELFTKNHKDMVRSGKEQLMGLGKTCSSLVAAVVFASSFSIPGDKDANQNPIFLHRTAFKVFSHAYVIGLSSAAASLVLFLSFLSSSYKEKDFRRSLPTKYFLANVSFLIALAALLVAFSCNIYLQIYGGKRAETKDIILLVCELTIFPAVCLLVLLYRGSSIGIGSFLQLVWR